MLYPSFTRTDFSCKVLIWICSIHFMTWWISKDVRVTARKRRHAMFKIKNICMILLEIIHNDRCCIVLHNSTVRWKGLVELQVAVYKAINGDSNMHVFHCSGRLELLCYSLKGALSVNKNIKQNWKTFSWNETIYLEIFTSEMDFLNSTVYYMYYYLDSTAILNFFHIWSAAVTIQYTSLFCSC